MPNFAIDSIMLNVIGQSVVMLSVVAPHHWYHDTQHNDSVHNDTQHDETQHDDTQHDDTHHDNTHHDDTYHDDTQHNNRWNAILSIMSVIHAEWRM